MPSSHTHTCEERVVTQTFIVSGLSCADCAAKLEKKLRSTARIADARLNFMAAKLSVTHCLPANELIKLIHDAGYDAALERQPTQRVHFARTHYRLLTTIVSGTLLVGGWVSTLAHLPHSLAIALYLAAVVIGGTWTIRRGVKSLLQGEFDMNALMTIAVIGAVLIREWGEAGSVAFLYSVSNMLESYTMEKTRHSIRGLMEIAPQQAMVRRNGTEMMVPVDEIVPDDLVIVRPGDKIAVDGIIESGSSAVNQSAITGESLPIEKGTGDEVFAGTMNEWGALTVRVSRRADDTTLAHIIHLVEEAQAKRAPSQAFVDRFARVYTPAVLILALLLAVIPPLFDQQWLTWVYRALTLIVVACPCALVISTPVAIVSAIGNAARHGVLIKGGAYLEAVARLKTLAFDKTGTLTEGRPVVTNIIPLNGWTTADILSAANAVEQRSTHALAGAIRKRAADDGVMLLPSQEHIAIPGKGEQATVEGSRISIGSLRLMGELGLDVQVAKSVVDGIATSGRTSVVVASGQQIIGAMAIADGVRTQSRPMIDELHHAGISRVVMLTGDRQSTADEIAHQLGIDDVRAELLPGEKAGAIQELMAAGPIGMVGDGVNDAPALATASVGISMGVAGTDTALETADIALMADDLTKIPYMVKLSRKALGVIKQNIALSLAIKLLAIALIFPGWLTLWMAVLADMGASILVTLNGMRLVGEKPRTTAGHACHDRCCVGC